MAMRAVVANKPWQAVHPEFTVGFIAASSLYASLALPQAKIRERGDERTPGLTMKLLLGGLLMALMLISELVGLFALPRYTASTVAGPSVQGSFTIVAARGDEDYQRVEWDGSSCGVWEVQREGEPRVKSPRPEGDIIGEVGDCGECTSGRT
jgi:hypothetical protein